MCNALRWNHHPKGTHLAFFWLANKPHYCLDQKRSTSRQNWLWAQHFGYCPYYHFPLCIQSGWWRERDMGLLFSLSTIKCHFNVYKAILQIANCLISSVERASINAAGSRLVIKCKHFLTLSLLVAKDKVWSISSTPLLSKSKNCLQDCQSLYETLMRCSKLRKFYNHTLTFSSSK